MLAMAGAAAVGRPTQRPAVRGHGQLQTLLEELWAKLEGVDTAALAIRELARLDAAPDFLKDRIAPARKHSPRALRALAEDLNHPRPVVRQQAANVLERVRCQAIPIVEDVLNHAAGPRHEQDLRRLLGKLKNPIACSTFMRDLRAVEVLERMATTPARRLLATWAEGDPDAELTREADAALHRLLPPRHLLGGRARQVELAHAFQRAE
jgi:hypothetical protein